MTGDAALEGSFWCPAFADIPLDSHLGETPVTNHLSSETKSVVYLKIGFFSILVYSKFSRTTMMVSFHVLLLEALL